MTVRERCRDDDDPPPPAHPGGAGRSVPERGDDLLAAADAALARALSADSAAFLRENRQESGQ